MREYTPSWFPKDPIPAGLGAYGTLMNQSYPSAKGVIVELLSNNIKLDKLNLKLEN